MALPVAGCPLCDEAGGRLVFQGAKLRVIHAAEAGFPAFYRVVWSEHVAEWSDLAPDDRALCMEAVQLMTAHHQGAIEMAKAEIANGDNVDAKALATNIVATQENEIGQMKQMLGG